MFNNKRFNQLYQKLSVQKGQENLYISNQYFKELMKLHNDKKIKNNHIPFTFAYLYFQHYMFRYAKYDNYVPKTTEIKELLGYNHNNKTIDYIIKDGGVIDTSGLTQTIYDFPVINEWVDNQPKFTMVSCLNDDNAYGTKWRKAKGINFNTSCKYPVLAFYSDLDVFEGVSLNNNYGTFFILDNSTNIDINVFLYCMSNDELKSTGFYLYSYLKWKCDCTEGEIYGIGYERLARETGLKLSTVKKYIKLLRQYNLLGCELGTYIIYAEGEEKNPSDLSPNRYSVNPFSWFYGDKRTELAKPLKITNAQLQKNKAMVENHKNEIESEMARLFSKTS